MLNWTSSGSGVFLFGLGGPLQNDTQESVPVSNDIVEGAKLHVWWGDPLLQGLHIGFFIALGALVVYWIILNRTTLGYGVKAVGFNPEAARYGGISVARNYFLAMAISGAFAGLAGAIDILGWQFRLSTGDVQTSQIGFVGHRRRPPRPQHGGGDGLAALLFGALVTGTSTRNLDPSIFQPELASNLTLLIQGLVVLFVGLDMVVLAAARAGAETEGARRDEHRAADGDGSTTACGSSPGSASAWACSRHSSPCRRRPCAPGCRASCSASSRS